MEIQTGGELMKYAKKMNKVFEEKHIQRICPICKYPHLEVVEAMYMVSMVDPMQNRPLKEEGMLLLPMLCKNCKFVMWFNQTILHEE